jgi:hypothetical protein
VGERVRFGDAPQTGPDSENKCAHRSHALTRLLLFLTRLATSLPRVTRVQKKKLWEAVQPDLRTLAGAAAYKDLPMTTSAGAVTAQRILNGSIS